MIKRLLTTLLLAVATVIAQEATPLLAQASPATATWQQPGADVPTATAYIYTLKVDAAAPIPLTQTCSVVNAVTQCTAPISGWVPGVHTVVLDVANSNGHASTTITTGAPPSTPTLFTITVTTTTTTTTTIAK